jgi:uncharacterized phage protein gp47/JayE
MPITTKTFDEFVKATTGKFTKEVPEVDSTIKASLARGSVVSAAAAGLSLQEVITDAVKQCFVQTASGEFLDLHGEYDETYRLTAQGASGNAIVNGTVGAVISTGDQVTANGTTYTVTSDTTVQAVTGNVFLEIIGDIVTATTFNDHTLATGLEVTILNSVETAYNGTYTVTVIDSRVFTFELEDNAGLTSSNAEYLSNIAVFPVSASTTGLSTNLNAGAALTVDIPGINTTAYADNNGISGGLDEEDTASFKERIMDNHVLIPGMGTKGALIASAKSLPGNTRVFVIRPVVGQLGGTPGSAGYLPAPGESVVYILRDDQASITPTQQQLDDTKDRILQHGNWPNFLPESYLYVLAPDLVQQNFVFSEILPDTPEMRLAIENKLVTFFEDNAEVGDPTHTIKLNTLYRFLDRIQDSTGARLISFTLTSITSDITVNAGELAVRGTVSYS